MEAQKGVALFPDGVCADAALTLLAGAWELEARVAGATTRCRLAAVLEDPGSAALIYVFADLEGRRCGLLEPTPPRLRELCLPAPGAALRRWPSGQFEPLTPAEWRVLCGAPRVNVGGGVVPASIVDDARVRGAASETDDSHEDIGEDESDAEEGDDGSGRGEDEEELEGATCGAAC